MSRGYCTVSILSGVYVRSRAKRSAAGYKPVPDQDKKQSKMLAILQPVAAECGLQVGVSGSLKQTAFCPRCKAILTGEPGKPAELVDKMRQHQCAQTKRLSGETLLEGRFLEGDPEAFKCTWSEYRAANPDADLEDTEKALIETGRYVGGGGAAVPYEVRISVPSLRKRETESRYEVVTELEGPESEVDAAIAKIKRDYPFAGYGTQIQYREAVSGGNVRAEVRRSRSC